MSPRPLRVDGRRLRPIRLSAGAAALGLGLVVLAFLTILAAALTGISELAAFGWVAGGVAVAMAGWHTWQRLEPRGRLVFSVPAILFLAWTVLSTLGLPGDDIVGYAAAVTAILGVAFGVVGRPALSAELALARAKIDPSLVRSERPAEPIRIELDARGLTFESDVPDGSDMWPADTLAGARWVGGGRETLRIRDRLGDEVSIAVALESRSEADELIRRIGELLDRR